MLTRSLPTSLRQLFCKIIYQVIVKFRQRFLEELFGINGLNPNVLRGHENTW